jgi:hypothetical protein
MSEPVTLDDLPDFFDDHLMEEADKSPPQFKPAGYNARDTIFKILEERLSQGISISDVTNSDIQAAIQEKFGYTETGGNISSYKFQFKKTRALKAERQRRTGIQSPEDIYKLAKYSYQIKEALKAIVQQWQEVDFDTLRCVVTAALDDLEKSPE